MPADGAFVPVDELPELPASWTWNRLGDLVDHTRGICYGIVQPGQHDAAGVPMVNSQDVLNGSVDSRIEFRVAKHLHDRFKRSTIRGGEILLTLVGANFGRVAIAPVALAGFNCSRAVGIIPIRESTRFVMFCLRSPFTRRFMDNWATTTAQPTFNLKEVANLPIPLPPFSERNAIANILGTLDDKIELNRRMNETLEAMARAIFKSWFVDFDPVRAKADGRQPAGMDTDTAALFPDSFEDSALGAIPKGWAVGKLDELAEIVMGTSPRGDTYNDAGIGVPLINGPVEFGDYFTLKRKWTTAPERMSESGDLVFCVRGSTTGRRVIADDVYCLGRGVCAIRTRHGTPAFIYALVEQSLDRLLSKVTGSVFPNLNGPDLKNFQTLCPPNEVVSAYQRVVEPSLRRIWLNEKQSGTLASTRDNLLPRLLSGEIRVPETEKLVEAAT